MNQDESLFQEGHFLIKICYLLDPPVIQRYLAVQVHNMGDSRVSLTCNFYESRHFNLASIYSIKIVYESHGDNSHKYIQHILAFETTFHVL
jgi:hypothetical protein